MKTFRRILSEVAAPKSDDEKHFRDKHLVQIIKHPVSDYKQHTGDIDGNGVEDHPKKHKRKADYKKGEDQAVYEGLDLDDEDLEDRLARERRMELKQKIYDEAKLDPVGQEDDDIDNDGDVDSSDSYLHNRRRAVTSAIRKKFRKESVELEEKAVSQAQQKAAAIALAVKRGKLPKSKLQGASKEMFNMSAKDLEDFAKTKLKGLPLKVYEEVELDEGAHGKYSFVVGSRMQGMGEGPPSHVVAKKLKMSKIGIPHHDDPGQYGHTVRVTVKNNETGETTHHHVYQSDTDRGSDKAIVSTRDVGRPRANQREHEKVLHNYLSGKRASSLKEEVELDESTMPYNIASALQDRHYSAAEHHKKKGNIKGYAAHFKVANQIEDAMVSAGSHMPVRSKRIEAASDKAFREHPHRMNESVDLDEISRETLASYNKKAMTQLAPLSAKKSKADRQMTNRIRSGKSLKGYRPKDQLSLEEEKLRRKRDIGGMRARNRLASIDKLSSERSHRYTGGDTVRNMKESLHLDEAMKLNKVNHVYHDSASETFAKEYVKGHKGDYHPGGPSEKHEKDSEKFHTTYERVGGKSGFGGSGHDIYQHTKTGEKYRVDRHSNGKGFHGTDHKISKIDEEVELDEDRKSTSYQFTHKPGDPESEKRLSDLKASVKGTGKRVVLQGRLGKDNPNAHKYSKNAPRAQYKDGKRVNADVSGKSGGHSHQRIQKADAAHHDVYVYDRRESVELDEISNELKARYHEKGREDVYNRFTGRGKYEKPKDPAHYTPTGRVKKGVLDRPEAVKYREKIASRNKYLAKVKDQLMKKEEFELDEISKNTLGSYIRKAALERGHAGIDAGAAGYKSKDQESALKKMKKRMIGISRATDRLTREEFELDEISKKTLGSYVKKAYTSAAQKKAAAGRVFNKADNAPYRSKEAHDLEKRGYKLSNKSRLRKKYADKAVDRLTKEEYELNEAFKGGSVKLNDGSSVLLKDQDAKLLNQLFDDLNPDNKKKMMKVAMTDKAGFNEILGFAREAL